jgi:hypothetical protein
MLLGVAPLARVCLELLAQVFRHPMSFSASLRDLGIRGATGAHPDGRDGTNPFDDPQDTFLRGQIFLWQIRGLLLANRAFHAALARAIVFILWTRRVSPCRAA